MADPTWWQRAVVYQIYPRSFQDSDGSGVGDIGPSVMREREALAQDGFVIVNLRLDKAGKLAGKPEIISRGFVFVRDADEMFAAAQEQITQAVARANGSAGSPQALKDKVTQTLADFFYAELKRRPMIFALVNDA